MPSTPFAQGSIRNYMTCGLVYDGLDCVEVGGPADHFSVGVEYDQGIAFEYRRSYERPEEKDDDTHQESEGPGDNAGPEEGRPDEEPLSNHCSEWKGRSNWQDSYAGQTGDDFDNYGIAQEYLARAVRQREEWSREKGRGKVGTSTETRNHRRGHTIRGANQLL